jgi:hypothetical protein
MKAILAATFLAITGAMAQAGDLGITFAKFEDGFHKVGVRMALNEKFVKQSCDSNPSTKRTICTHKLGDFMIVMTSTKGDDPITEITMICATEDIRAAAKCMVAMSAAIAATSPERDLKERAAIIKTLLAGLDVGDSTTIQSEDRKFVLQKSMGLWFHIVADQ